MQRVSAGARHQNNDGAHKSKSSCELKSSVRPKRECTRTHTLTHERQRRSCGAAAVTHAGGCSTLIIKHAASASGSAVGTNNGAHTHIHDHMSGSCEAAVEHCANELVLAQHWVSNKQRASAARREIKERVHTHSHTHTRGCCEAAVSQRPNILVAVQH